MVMTLYNNLSVIYHILREREKREDGMDEETVKKVVK